MKTFLEIFCVMFSAILVHGLLTKPEGTNKLLKETIDLLIREQTVEESVRALNTGDSKQLTHVDDTSDNNGVLVHNIQPFVDAKRRRIHGVSQVGGSWITQYPLNRGTVTTTQATSTPSSPPLPSTVATTTSTSPTTTTSTTSTTASPTTTTTSTTTTIHIEWPPIWDFCKRSRWTGIWCKRPSFDWMSNLERIRIL